ncbi:hypothetical protein [Agaribacter marinus]|uniref:Lipoprotein n=1 Tax=Agaribacter marinus TaxID=1431249 RepID=A0AA37SXT2_9ALTE|nr:hypothetical protein [Agaribacter marinus]GLR71787.1 hypothetical protein GCM10007852_26950 [Agaribacter marinus]
MKLRTFLLCYSLILFTGCQIIEEGEVDYVRTVENNALSAKDITQCDKALYDKSEYTRAGVTRECYETLYRKYTKVPQIASGDTISVHLMQAFNGAAFEWKNASEFFGRRGSNAEMVIIANVCEQGKAGCSMSFGPSADKNGRVIFYSNGVKALQYLNLSYLPVYGPIKYEGGPLIIQLTIVELDDPSDQQKAMLQSLASAGKQLYPPASDVLTVLDSVGSAILSNSSDDILFRYSMTLVPDSQSQNYQSPIVAEGNYAFIRKNTNKGPLETELLDKLYFDNLSGRLVEECEKDDKELTRVDYDDGTFDEFDYIPCTLDLNTGKYFKDYRKNTYLTFQIKSGFVEKTLDNIQTFELLLNDLNQAADESAAQAVQAISGLENTFSSRAKEASLQKSLNTLKTIVSDITKNKFDLFSIEASKFVKLYDIELNKMKTAKCDDIPLPPECESLISSEQVQQFQIELHAFLESINPNPAHQLSTIIPLGSEPLSDAGKVKTVLQNGYKKFFNKALFEKFSGELQAIDKLVANVSDIKVRASAPEALKKRKALLIANVNNFLSELALEHANALTKTCPSITNQDCYLNLTTTQKQALINAFNQFLARNIHGATAIDASTDANLTTSLSAANILALEKLIENAF